MTNKEKIEYLQKYYTNEKGQVELKCKCDGTEIFAYNLYKTLYDLGFKIVDIESRPATEDEIPKDKPFCDWVFIVRGVLPQEVEE